MNITTFGLDIAKNVMQVHWVDDSTGEAQLQGLEQQLDSARGVHQIPGGGLLGATALEATLGEDAKGYRWPVE